MRSPLAAALLLALAAPAYADGYSGGGGSPPGGTNGQIQYNNSGAFGGRNPSGNGTTIATTTGTLTSGHYAGIDANGNLVDSGTAYGGSGVTSLSTSCPASPSQPLSGAVTLANGVATNARTGSPYVLVVATDATNDCANLTTVADGSAVSLVTANYTAGNYFIVKNIGTADVVITPTSGTINGATSITLLSYQTVTIVFDGTNYQGLQQRIGRPYMPQLISGTAHNYKAATYIATGTVTSTTAFDKTVTYFCPIFIDRTMTLEGVGFYATTAQTPGNSDTTYYGLFANSATTGRPTGSVLWSGSNAANTSSGFLNAGSLSPATYKVTPGWWWFGFQFGSGAASNSLRAKIITSSGLSPWVDATSESTAASALVFSSVQQTSTTAGTWPNPIGTLAEAGVAGVGCPIFVVQYASIP